MPKSRVIDFFTARRNAASGRSFRTPIDDLPDVPVLPETLLAMELVRSSEPVDLRGFGEAVLSDLGATIQVLRLASHEYGTSEDRPMRIEDCISALGIEECMRVAIEGMYAQCNGRASNVVELWGHSAEIGRQCQRLAETTDEINPCQAYLAGLLHDIGALPGVLGWGRRDLTGDFALCALKMAMQWSLPDFLREYFREAYLPGYNREWTALMAEAHLTACETWAWCPLNELNVQMPASMKP